MALRRLVSILFWSRKLIRSGPWERKEKNEKLSRTKLVEKWRFWLGFDAILKLKTDEKWFLGAKTNIEEKYLFEKWHFTFGFDAVLKLKTDEQWSLGTNKILPRKNVWSKKDTVRLVLMLFWNWKLIRIGPWERMFLVFFLRRKIILFVWFWRCFEVENWWEVVPRNYTFFIQFKKDSIQFKKAEVQIKKRWSTN